MNFIISTVKAILQKIHHNHHKGYDPDLPCHIYENLCKVEVQFFLYSAVWECYLNLPNNYYQIGSFFLDKLK